MEEASAEREEGFIITNPPNGERLRDEDYVKNLYQQMRHLKKDFKAWNMAIITTHPDFPELFGSPARAVKEIQNGPEHTFVYHYENIG
jgi:putative N6-adenine-specific DNA methylase